MKQSDFNDGNLLYRETIEIHASCYRSASSRHKWYGHARYSLLCCCYPRESWNKFPLSSLPVVIRVDTYVSIYIKGQQGCVSVDVLVRLKYVASNYSLTIPYGRCSSYRAYHRSLWLSSSTCRNNPVGGCVCFIHTESKRWRFLFLYWFPFLIVQRTINKRFVTVFFVCPCIYHYLSK